MHQMASPGLARLLTAVEPAAKAIIELFAVGVSRPAVQLGIWRLQASVARLTGGPAACRDINSARQGVLCVAAWCSEQAAPGLMSPTQQCLTR